MSIAMILILIGAFGILIVVALYLLGGNGKKEKGKENMASIVRGEVKDEVNVNQDANTVSTNASNNEENLHQVPIAKDTYIEAQKDIEKNSNKTVVLGKNKRIPAFLVVKKGPNFGEKYDVVLEDDTTIGREKLNYIVIDDQIVSDKHALIRLSNNEFVLHDLASTNGSFVNGERLKKPRILENSDVIAIGNIELVFYKLEQ